MLPSVGILCLYLVYHKGCLNLDINDDNYGLVSFTYNHVCDVPPKETKKGYTSWFSFNSHGFTSVVEGGNLHILCAM